MLFDVRPKTSIKDLFGRRAEYLYFKDSIEKGRNFIIITGPRRIGKTSFLYATLNELHKEMGVDHLVIDARAATAINSKYPQRIIATQLFNALNGNLPQRAITKISSLQIGPIGVSFSNEQPNIVDLLSALNRSGKRVIIAFDEAQYLRFSNEDLTRLFAWVLDTLENVTLVITGSQVGVLESFLRLDDGTSPLFGRYETRIQLPRFNPSESVEFLTRGFKEVGIHVDETELLSTVRTLDGIPGWLVHYGTARVDGMTHEEAVEHVLSKAMTYVMSEFQELEGRSPRYRILMKIIAELSEGRGYAKFEAIKGRMKNIDDKSLWRYLSKLIDYGFLENMGYGEYRIPDPVVYRVFRRL